MRRRTGQLVIAFLAMLTLALVAPMVSAQDQSPAAPAPQYNVAQLDQLLAPIALYPDALLGQILMASTYPLEVVQAARWVQDPANAALQGDALSSVLETFDWDPSVKALVPFPSVLQMMNGNLDWMQQLGDAFLAQQADVMDTVQRLRQQAQSAGTLASTPQQTVIAEGGTITIEPANPDVLYVPVYDPVAVYGAWSYPAYPPYVFPPLPGYYYGPLAAGVGFGVGLVVVHTLWGWDHFDWRHHRIDVDAHHKNVINRYFIEHFHRPRFAGHEWEHDPQHRIGVPYRNPQVRERFEHKLPGSLQNPYQYRAPALPPPTVRVPPLQPSLGRRPPGSLEHPSPQTNNRPPVATHQGSRSGAETHEHSHRAHENREIHKTPPRSTPADGGDGSHADGSPRH